MEGKERKKENEVENADHSLEKGIQQFIVRQAKLTPPKGSSLWKSTLVFTITKL